MKTVRLMGHAGSDHEAAYRTPGEILADLERDPVLCTAKLLVRAGCLTPADVLDMYEDKRAEVLELAEEVSELPQLSSPAAVMKPITDALAEAATTTSAGAAPGPRRRSTESRSPSPARSTGR